MSQQKRMRCPQCKGVGVYDKIEDRFFCMDCGFDSKQEPKFTSADAHHAMTGE